MGTVLDIVIFTFLGVVLGFVIPFVAAHIYVLGLKAKEGDEADLTGAGAFSFIPIITVPVGGIIGCIIGISGLLQIFGG